MRPKTENMLIRFIIFIFFMSISTITLAGVSPEKASELKTVLTPTGAEGAGNADGSIPAWKGGITSINPGFRKGLPHIDPFAGDKVLFTITAANLEQYADKLSEGQKALLKKFPDTYKMNVYQSRRSHSGPEWYYENTFKNATSARLTQDGCGITGSFAGIAFPIPQKAEEIMWNFFTRWRGTYLNYKFDNIIIPPKGEPVIASSSIVNEKVSYYDLKMGFDAYNAGENPLLFHLINKYIGPPGKKGEIIIVKEPLEQTGNKRQAWHYLPGQRRVRQTSPLEYDTPNPGAPEHMTCDDEFMFNGSLDRYNWKIIGKKEMYIPYNCYKLEQKLPLAMLFPPNHPDSEFWRWELHRVWVVEAAVKQGKRHVYAKRVMYFDEDSWTMPMRDIYDARGNLWRTAYAALKNAYELPGVVQMPNLFIDFYAPQYVVNFSMHRYKELIDYENVPDETQWTPENIQRLRKQQ